MEIFAIPLHLNKTVFGDTLVLYCLSYIIYVCMYMICLYVCILGMKVYVCSYVYMYMFMSIVLKITTNTLEVHVLVIQINFDIRVFFRRYLKAVERLISTLHHADKASASMHTPPFSFLIFRQVLIKNMFPSKRFEYRGNKQIPKSFSHIRHGMLYMLYPFVYLRRGSKAF